MPCWAQNFLFLSQLQVKLNEQRAKILKERARTRFRYLLRVRFVFSVVCREVGCRHNVAHFDPGDWQIVERLFRRSSFAIPRKNWPLIRGGREVTRGGEIGVEARRNVTFLSKIHEVLCCKREGGVVW